MIGMICRCDWCGVSWWGLWLCTSVGWARSFWAASVMAASIPVLWSRVASMLNSNGSRCDVLWKWDCHLDWLQLSLSSWWCLKFDLAWWLLCDLWCVPGVPEGGILCGQSMTMWPYSSHPWHLMWGQCHVICPGSWYWKQQSSSFNITLTVEGRIIVAVSCCSGIKLFHFWDGISECLRSFFIDVCCQTMEIFQYFDKNPNSGSIICEVASLCLCFKPVDACGCMLQGIPFLAVGYPWNMQGIRYGYYHCKVWAIVNPLSLPKTCQRWFLLWPMYRINHLALAFTSLASAFIC